MNCPICNHSVNPSSYFCENCDFEIMIISNNSSDELKEYMLNRQEKFKTNYQEKLKLNNQIQKIENNLENKINELKDAQILINKQKEDIDQFKGKVATTLEELNRLKAFENTARENSETIKNLNFQIDDLNKKVVDTSKFKEIDSLLKEAINYLANGNQDLHSKLVNKYNKIKI